MNRYSDFFVHRQIIAALQNEYTSVYDSLKVANISEANQLAISSCAEKIKYLYLAKYLKENSSKIRIQSLGFNYRLLA